MAKLKFVWPVNMMSYCPKIILSNETDLIIIWNYALMSFTKILMLQQAVTFIADSPEENIKTIFFVTKVKTSLTSS